MLFLFHTFMIYNCFGENFYVKSVGMIFPNDFILAVSPWFMPLMFVLAGISASYALKNARPLSMLKRE